MAAAYSMDLRERVIQDAEAGVLSKQLAARYHVSLTWVNALKQRKRETGSLSPCASRTAAQAITFPRGLRMNGRCGSR